VRNLLGRIARGEGALGAACIAGLLACALILIAALTLENAQVDHRSEAAEIRALVASGRELGRVIAMATPDNQPAALQAWNRRQPRRGRRLLRDPAAGSAPGRAGAGGSRLI